MGGIEKNQKIKRIAREKNKRKRRVKENIIGQRKGRASREAWGSLGWRDGWMARRSVGGTSRASEKRFVRYG